jgi:hypothetical protein
MAKKVNQWPAVLVLLLLAASILAGGADHPSNMQWQTVDAAKETDRIE